MNPSLDATGNMSSQVGRLVWLGGTDLQVEDRKLIERGGIPISFSQNGWGGPSRSRTRDAN